jgi:hypothetical protein
MKTFFEVTIIECDKQEPMEAISALLNLGWKVKLLHIGMNDQYNTVTRTLHVFKD